MLLKDQGNRHFVAGEFGDADQCYSLALQYVDPSETNLYVTLLSNRAAARLRLHRYSEAFFDTNQALLVMPSHVKARFRQAEALVGKGMFTEGMQLFQKLKNEGVTDATSQMNTIRRKMREYNGEFDMSYLYSLERDQHESFTDYIGPLVICHTNSSNKKVVASADIPAQHIVLVEKAVSLCCDTAENILGVLTASLHMACLRSSLLCKKLSLLHDHCTEMTPCPLQEGSTSKDCDRSDELRGSEAVGTVSPPEPPEHSLHSREVDGVPLQDAMNLFQSQDESMDVLHSPIGTPVPSDASRLAAPAPVNEKLATEGTTLDTDKVMKVVTACAFVSGEGEGEGGASDLVEYGLWLVSSLLRPHGAYAGGGGEEEGRDGGRSVNAEAVVHGRLLIVRSTCAIAAGQEVVLPALGDLSTQMSKTPVHGETDRHEERINSTILSKYVSSTVHAGHGVDFGCFDVTI